MTFQRMGQLGIVATVAEATPDEAAVAVRTMRSVAIYKTADLLQGGTRPRALHFSVEGLKEPQGEGAALDSNGRLYLASEAQWMPGGRLISLQCTLE